MCEDPECITKQTSAHLNFTFNPTEKDEFGFHNAIINIDRGFTELNQEVYIMGTTLDPNVNVTAKGKVAVCGERFSFAADDPQDDLTTMLLAPNEEESKILNLLSLFSFAIPSLVFPTEACLTEVRICSTVDICKVEEDYADQFLIDGYELHIRLN